LRKFDKLALHTLRKQAGAHFDPIVVKAFEEIIDLERRSNRKKPSSKDQ
jgi:response regulator RpfG family c-di-GMP phosphodiesterase